MPITKAENIRVDGLDSKESRKLIIKIAHEQKWEWWFNDEDKLVIDPKGSFIEDMVDDQA